MKSDIKCVNKTMFLHKSIKKARLKIHKRVIQKIKPLVSLPPMKSSLSFFLFSNLAFNFYISKQTKKFCHNREIHYRETKRPSNQIGLDLVQAQYNK